MVLRGHVCAAAAVLAALVLGAACGRSEGTTPTADAGQTDAGLDSSAQRCQGGVAPDASVPDASPWFVPNDAVQYFHFDRDRAGNLFVAGHRGFPYLAKFGPDGVLQWERAIEAAGAGFTSMAAGADGAVVVVGSAGQRAGFQFEGFAVGPSAGFLLRFDGNGELIVARELPHPGPLSFAEPHAVAVLSTGAMVVIGRMLGTVDFGGGPLASSPLGMFFVQYDACGRYVTSRLLSADNFAPQPRVVVDREDRIVVAGYFQDVDVGGGASSAPISIVLFDSRGQYLAQRPIRGREVWIDALHSAPTGELFLSGRFVELDVGGGPLPITGDADAFVAKLGGDLAFSWARALGGPGHQEALGVASDDAGRAVITGVIRDGTLDADGTLLTAPAQGSMFLVRLDPSGGVLRALVAKGSQYGESSGHGVRVLRGDDVAIVGFYAGAFQLGPLNLPSKSGSGAFVARLPF